MKAPSEGKEAAAVAKTSVKHRRRLPASTDQHSAITPGALSLEKQSPRSDQAQQCNTIISSCGDHEGRVSGEACPSIFDCQACSQVLHELSNVMSGVLANAQVLGWKLPPYSHLKRPVRELERSAQRGGELLKRLVQRCTD